MSEEKIVTSAYEKKEFLSGSVKRYISTIVMVLAVIGFAVKDIFKFEPVDIASKIVVVTVSAAITYFFTVYVCIYMHNLGKKLGKDTESYKAATGRLSSKKKEITDKGISYLLPFYCQRKTKQKLIELKTEIITNSTLNFKLYTKGYYKDHVENLTDKQKQAIKEADELKITPLTSEELLSECQLPNKYKNPFDFGKREKSYDRSKTTAILLKKAIVPMIFSPVTVSILFSQNIVYSLFQTVIILLCSIPYLTGAEEYVLLELRERYIEKADYLEEFIALYENDKNIFKDAEEELNYYLQDEVKPDSPQFKMDVNKEFEIELLNENKERASA